MWLPIILINVLCTTVFSAPSLELLRGTTGLGPKCFPTRPYCIRPRAEECRDAIVVMHGTDPGYPLIFGRSEIIKEAPHTYAVPHLWSSLPVNCIVKLDVTDPRATEEATLRSLAAMAEVVVRRCIVGGTGCGGSVSIGKGGSLNLMVAYYTVMDRVGGLLAWHSNITQLADDDI